jgi:putative transposase
MPREARIIIPDVPHHVIQRGNRRQDVFFSDDDKRFYLKLLLKWSHIAGLTIWAYCLMKNHVHFVVVPFCEASLRKCFGEVHKRYSQVINRRQGWKGYLWQGRFLSYPMDEAYRYRGIRYVELNPVRAGIVKDPSSYPWSSARAHTRGEKDPLLGKNPLGMSGQEWSKYLAQGLIESETELFRDHSRSQRPLAGEDFLRKFDLL